MTDKPAQVSIEAQIEACEWAEEAAGRDAKWSTPHEDRWRALRAAAATLRRVQSGELVTAPRNECDCHLRHSEAWICPVHGSVDGSRYG